MEVRSHSIDGYTFGLAFDNSLRYPIKYAILEMKNIEGFQLDELLIKPVTTPVAYIVSKCYLVGEKSTYLGSGKIRTSYDVVFPYISSDLSNLEDQHRIVPKVSLNGDCVNSISVSQVFSSFDEASKEADHLNNELLRHQIRCLPLDKIKEQNPRKKQKMILKLCKELEQRLEKATSDMIVFPTSLQQLIAKIMERPEEFYIKLAEALSPEEREYLKMVFKDKSCANCMNGSCRIESSEKVGLDESGKPQGSDCVRWNNSELIGRLALKMKA